MGFTVDKHCTHSVYGFRDLEDLALWTYFIYRMLFWKKSSDIATSAYLGCLCNKMPLK